jgi:hypothetical protein
MTTKVNKTEQGVWVVIDSKSSSNPVTGFETEEKAEVFAAAWRKFSDIESIYDFDGKPRRNIGAWELGETATDFVRYETMFQWNGGQHVADFRIQEDGFNVSVEATPEVTGEGYEPVDDSFYYDGGYDKFGVALCKGIEWMLKHGKNHLKKHLSEHHNWEKVGEMEYLFKPENKKLKVEKDGERAYRMFLYDMDGTDDYGRKGELLGSSGAGAIKEDAKERLQRIMDENTISIDINDIL